jgi:hypothetical protein
MTAYRLDCRDKLSFKEEHFVAGDETYWPA